MTTRRELITGATAAVATVGVPVLNTTAAQAQNGNNNNGCQRPQHFRQSYTVYVFNVCTNEYVRLTLDLKQTVQSCVKADGSLSFRLHIKLHGSGYGVDIFTDSPTGTNYIVNAQDKLRIVDGPFGGPSCIPFSQIETYREKMISKGGSPNSSIVLHHAFTIDSSCRTNFDTRVEMECKAG